MYVRVSRNNHYANFRFQSAVLLNANVAYLAIPGILDQQTPNTLGVVASLISIVMSLASVILGLLLTKRLRGYEEKGMNDVVRYFSDSLRFLPRITMVYRLAF